MKKSISKSFLIFTASLFFISLLCINKDCKADGWIVPPPQTGTYQGVSWVAGDYIYLVKDSCRVQKTSDLGATWTTTSVGCNRLFKGINWLRNKFGQGMNMAVTLDTLCIVGEGGEIFYTSNSGLNWIQQVSGTTLDITGLSFVDNQTGWAVGGSNTACVILHTTNAGTNWSPQNITLTFGLLSVSFGDATHGWASASHNTIIYTSNGGTNWIDRSPSLPATSIWFSTFFINQDTGWAVGNNGTGQALTIRTTNGGITWNLGNVSSGNPQTLACVSFVNSNTGFAAGGSFSNTGTVLKTTDGGQNWVSQTLPAGTSFLNAVTFLNPDTGMVCGNNGQILYTFSGGEPIGITSISGNVPKNFELYQNYPNPFNPATTIKFDLQKKSNIKLLIYDVTGRTVQTESKDNLNLGSYEYKWDASNYSSGVYFYKLITNDFTETKKMILTK